MKIIITFIFTLFVFSSCNNVLNERVIKLEKEVILLRDHIEQKNQVSFSDTTSVPTFKWFRLGKSSGSNVNTHFNVQAVTSEYKNNGYEISGFITNLMSIRTLQTEVVGAIFNNSKSDKVITGAVEISELNPGVKTGFKLFIPTSQTNVDMVGIKIRTGRM